jgi:hypothetical protein
MRTMTLVKSIMAVAVVAASGCGLVGPSCLDQKKSGLVAVVSGRLEAGQVVSHLVPYDTRGSQNDAKITFTGQGTLTGPRVMVYATPASCVNFRPPTPTDPGLNQGDCTPIGNPGGYLGPDGALVPTTLTLTGPGNGAPAGFHEYKLFVVGDPAQAASYSISITWFSGPDC